MPKKLIRLPVVDNPERNVLELLVETYYQIKGYITSINKFYSGKKDADLLAVNGNELYIVSVVTNLDDKTKESDIKYFKEIEEFLTNTNQYSWLMADKSIHNIIAYYTENPGNREKIKKLSKEILSKDVEFLSFKEIIFDIVSYLIKNDIPNLPKNTKAINCRNPMLKLMEWLIRMKKSEIIKLFKLEEE